MGSGIWIEEQGKGSLAEGAENAEKKIATRRLKRHKKEKDNAYWNE